MKCFKCSFLENSFSQYKLGILWSPETSCLATADESLFKACKAIYMGGNNSGSNLIHSFMHTSKVNNYSYGQSMVLDFKKTEFNEQCLKSAERYF